VEEMFDRLGKQQAGQQALHLSAFSLLCLYQLSDGNADKPGN